MTTGSSTPTKMNPFEALSNELDADVYLYSGMIHRDAAHDFVKEYRNAQDKSNCILFLCTYGGDPDAAYIIARHLKHHYDHFSLYVYGMCKSAGTLIALGADEIVMWKHGEFGPLDVQLFRDDQLIRQSSGLDTIQALSIINSQAFKSFEQFFLQILTRGGGAITTKTAADIATSLTTGLLGPIAGQIDPHRLSEVQRAINIAMQYGMRLGARQDTLINLIYNYPSHGFVIDFEEAESLFENIREPSLLENETARILQSILMQNYSEECLLTPHSSGVVACLTRKQEIEDEDQAEGASDPATDVEGHPAASHEETDGRSGSDDRHGESDSGGDSLIRSHGNGHREGESVEALPQE